MWFNNFVVYRFNADKLENLQEALFEERLKPCPPHARFLFGWMPVLNEELSHEIAGCQLISMGKEERILPRSVIQRFLKEKIDTIQEAEGRTIKRAEKAQMAEDLEFDLLPKAFCIQKKLPAILDSMSQQLFINTSSANQASQLIALLKKSVSGLDVEPVSADQGLSAVFAKWIADPGLLPQGFQLASDCLLFSPSNEKKKINCKGYELPADEILTLLSQGLVPAEISLVWQERVHFTLTQDLIFKRVKCSDYLIDEFNEIKKLDEEIAQRDAALTLLAGELRALVKQVMQVVNIEEKAEAIV